jgi:arylsulfatase A
MKRSQAAGKPFFIQMSYNALHYPENATPALVEKYRKLASGRNDKEVGRAAIAEDLDRGVGELLAKLDAMGLSKNTIVIYMSDNGGSNRRTLNGGKGDVWEGGIRVPLIIRGPGIAPNSWCHQRVVGYDFFPTFCRWAGVKAPLPKEIEGGDITHLLRRFIRARETPSRAAGVSFPALSRRLAALGDPQRPHEAPPLLRNG